MLKLAETLSRFMQDSATFSAAEALYSECFKGSEVFTSVDDVYSMQHLAACLMNHLEEQGIAFNEAQVLEILPTVEFVELCNYKGEGEGFTLACRTKHMRTFRSKYNYR
jgi:hypothetical protein